MTTTLAYLNAFFSGWMSIGFFSLFINLHWRFVFYISVALVSYRIYKDKKIFDGAVRIEVLIKFAGDLIFIWLCRKDNGVIIGIPSRETIMQRVMGLKW